jgi:hypothetical protein
LITKSSSHVSDGFLNESLIPILLKLAKYPVPNIKFNVSKAIEQLYKKLSNSNKLKCQDALKDMEKDDDFDVRYYADKASKAVVIK